MTTTPEKRVRIAGRRGSPQIPILWSIELVVLIIGLVLLALGAMGRAVGGRKHYY